jgi:hypothetical protein
MSEGFHVNNRGCTFKWNFRFDDPYNRYESDPWITQGDATSTVLYTTLYAENNGLWALPNVPYLWKYYGGGNVYVRYNEHLQDCHVDQMNGFINETLCYDVTLLNEGLVQNCARDMFGVTSPPPQVPSTTAAAATTTAAPGTTTPPVPEVSSTTPGASTTTEAAAEVSTTTTTVPQTTAAATTVAPGGGGEGEESTDMPMYTTTDVFYATPCMNDEFSGLQQMMGNVENLPADWFSTCNPCEWTGVQCKGDEHHDGHEVTGIWLHGYGLSGTLDLSGLPPHVNVLELQDNALYGTLNCSHLNTHNLEYVHLHTNAFNDVFSCDINSLPNTVIQFDATVNGMLYCPLNTDYDNLMNAFQGTTNIPSDWFHACNYCVWTGVQCSYGLVTDIVLPNITGSVDLLQLEAKGIDMSMHLYRDFE